MRKRAQTPPSEVKVRRRSFYAKLTKTGEREKTMSGLVESQELLVRWATNVFLELTTFGCQNITNTIKDTLTYLKTCI